jgi:hypothetical protein
MRCRVGKGVRREAPGDVPTIASTVRRIKMVGTAQERLCPPYNFIMSTTRPIALRSISSRIAFA